MQTTTTTTTTQTTTSYLIDINSRLNKNDELIASSKDDNNDIIVSTLQWIRAKAKEENIVDIKVATEFLKSLKKEIKKEIKNKKIDIIFSMARKVIVNDVQIRYSILSKQQLEKLLKTNDFEAINKIASQTKGALKAVGSEEEKNIVLQNYIDSINSLIEQYTTVKDTKTKVIKGKNANK